jgi:hypothetical protein
MVLAGGVARIAEGSIADILTNTARFDLLDIFASSSTGLPKITSIADWKCGIKEIRQWRIITHIRGVGVR